MNAIMNTIMNKTSNKTMNKTTNTYNQSCDCNEGGVMTMSAHDIKETDTWITQLMTNAHNVSDQFQLSMNVIILLRVELGWYVSVNNPYAQDLVLTEHMLQLPQKLYSYNRETIKAKLDIMVKYTQMLMVESCQELNMPHNEVSKVLNGINAYNYETLEVPQFYRCSCGMACCV